jgi:D-arabinose 1-dehydrogenase-like Zn-dependent alcohol dehydrogenase
MKVTQAPIPEQISRSSSARFVRIKVQACGVCHSDVLTKEGSWPGTQYPLQDMKWRASSMKWVSVFQGRGYRTRVRKRGARKKLGASVYIDSKSMNPAETLQKLGGGY